MAIPRSETLSPDDLLVFATIARERGVRGAAAALGMAKSTVSQKLAVLEAAVGARLVTRTTRRFELTELGEELAEACDRLEEVVRASREIVEKSAHEPTGVLRVAASPLVGSEFLPEVISELLARHSRVRVELHLSSDYIDLRRTRIDVAIRTGPLDDASDLYAVRLGTSLTGHYASPSYLAARGAPASPEELASHDCLIVGSARRSTWAFDGANGAIRVPVAGRLCVDSFAIARDCAVGGAGILRTARFYVRSLVDSGALVPVLRKRWPRVTLFAVHTAGRSPPPKVRAFIALLKTQMKGKLEA